MQKLRETAAILGGVFPDAEIHAALYYVNIEPFIDEEANWQGIHLIKASDLNQVTSASPAENIELYALK